MAIQELLFCKRVSPASEWCGGHAPSGCSGVLGNMSVQVRQNLHNSKTVSASLCPRMQQLSHKNPTLVKQSEFW